MSSSDQPVGTSGPPGTRPTRVLVVDDSAFMRKLVSEVVESTGEFTVVGTARDGKEALRQVAVLDPDIVTLDVDMPALNGLAALEFIMRDHPRPVVMLSGGGTDSGADATLRALERGAVDFVRKPSGAISLDLDVVREHLLQALRASVDVQVAAHPVLTSGQLPVPPRAVPLQLPLAGAPSRVVCIAASTGGPAALSQLLPALPAWPDTAVLVVQHMPPGFTASLARRLDAASALTVHEAGDNEPLRAGHAYIAPGGRHVRLHGPREVPRLLLGDDPAQWGVRPAADPLFQSVAQVYGAQTVAVVLTGMGCDAAEGARAIRAAGGRVVVQDRATSVVPGMPDAALRAGGADAVAPLHELAAVIAAQVDVLERRLQLRESA
ncbi:chemotaxis response regulator protein-glutamate methylesterase [Gemmatimonas sp.]|uniref:protein-glutamate methylesterase/protein-glutamine glutaminase n=1 Tax=Gemmatimonas sp. TaxID=1962908 RepID=UPI0022C500B4|nr:chemotaxis response regulator protein-glutamate methylesterase [Gemmatimonas sp.]MCZ8204596.1 chemotaxis response regulator protein-glutamate methylesterase [Gemmatimonas sp.]